MNIHKIIKIIGIVLLTIWAVSTVVAISIIVIKKMNHTEVAVQDQKNLPTEIVIGKVNEYTISTFYDSTKNVQCYIYNAKLSCVKL